MNNLIKKTFVDGDFSMDVNVSKEDDTVWLSTKEIAKLYDRTPNNISKRIKNILQTENKSENRTMDSEYTVEAVLEIVATNGRSYKVKHYNLDMICEIGKRVGSNRGELLKQFYEKIKEPNELIQLQNTDVIIYNNGQFQMPINFSIEERTMWLSQDQIAKLFDTTIPNISMHISNILKEGELDSSVFKDFLTTAPDGKKYYKRFYNLKMIWSLGFRVSSDNAKAFRIWANDVIDKYARYGSLYSDSESKVLLNEVNKNVLSIKDFLMNGGPTYKNEEELFISGDYSDARNYMHDLFMQAKRCIYIIDSYFDSLGLTFLDSLDASIEKRVYLSKIAKLNEEDVNAFNKQYGGLSIYYTEEFHDRFLIIDEEICYSLGASLNRMGTKVFIIIRINTKKIINQILDLLRDIDKIECSKL